MSERPRTWRLLDAVRSLSGEEALPTLAQCLALEIGDAAKLIIGADDNSIEARWSVIGVVPPDQHGVGRSYTGTIRTASSNPRQPVPFTVVSFVPRQICGIKKQPFNKAEL